MMRRLACVLALAACGSNAADPAAPSAGSAAGSAPAASPSTSLTSLATVLAELEDVRPFIVVENGRIQCDKYTAEASAVIGNLEAVTERATSARRSARQADVESWQRAHAPKIEALIAELATPTRSAVHCENLQRDQTWARIKRALVAIAQPPTPPDAVVERAALLAELLAAADTIQSEPDCKATIEKLMAKHAGMAEKFAAMTPIEKFIDDHVWEEDDEKTIAAHPQSEKLSKYCGL